MNQVAGVFQGRLANLTFKFAQKLFAFCMKPRNKSIEACDCDSLTTRAVSVTRKAYLSPYERAVVLLERLLALPCIAPIVYPVLVEENAQHTGAIKDPLAPLRTLFGRGCTLNILVNELESPFVPTIDLYEAATSGEYEEHQISMFWNGCVGAGLVSEEALGRVGELCDPGDAQCLELMLGTVSRILDVLQQRGAFGTPDARYMRPRDMYPLAAVVGGEPRHMVLAAELSRTEVAYVQDLEKLVAYADAVSAQLGPDEAAAIFGHIHGILLLHRKFSARIQYLAAMPLRRQLFDAAYAGLVDEFDVYSGFCAQRELSQRAFDRALPALRQLETELDPVFDIPSLFMRPVQRLAQYPILFQSIVDAQCESCRAMDLEQHDSVQLVKPAFAAMQLSKRILTRANESTREAVNESQHVQFLERLDEDPLLPPTTPQRLGRLLTSDRVSAQVGRHFENAEGYLFETSLIVCSPVELNKRASRVRRTISALQVMRGTSRSRREERRRSGESVSSSTLHSPSSRARSPALEGCSPEDKISLMGFQLPSIETGHTLTLTSPPPTPITNPLSSNVSLNTLRDRPLIRFVSDSSSTATADEPERTQSRLAIRQSIATASITQISQLSELDGTLCLNIQAMNDGEEVLVVFRRLTKEGAAVWLRMLKRAVPLVPVEESVAQGNDNYCLLVNPRYAQFVLGKKI
ncbi:Guanine nucleotide exchange factor for Cdc42p [Coemansia sp. RSA 552]|nr:Guanine nucleotide exchange factor for Cdc42p [Coemansia sp. RSA 552]